MSKGGATDIGNDSITTRWLVYIGIVAFCFCIMYNAGKMLGGWIAA